MAKLYLGESKQCREGCIALRSSEHILGAGSSMQQGCHSSSSCRSLQDRTSRAQPIASYCRISWEETLELLPHSLLSSSSRQDLRPLMNPEVPIYLNCLPWSFGVATKNLCGRPRPIKITFNITIPPVFKIDQRNQLQFVVKNGRRTADGYGVFPRECNQCT
jgi:hypothetical protein